MDVTLFGNGVFTDVIKLRYDCPYKKRKRHTDKRYTGIHHVTIKADIGVLCLQTKGCQGLLRTAEA